MTSPLDELDLLKVVAVPLQALQERDKVNLLSSFSVCTYDPTFAPSLTSEPFPLAFRRHVENG